MANGMRGSAGGLPLAVGLMTSLSLSAFGRPGVVFAQAGPDRETETLEDDIGRLEALLDAQQARIRSLKKQIESIEDRPTDAVRLAQLRRVVRNLMADSDFRERLYPDIQQVGYDRGFYIRSADEAFLLKINSWFQVRWTGQNRQTDNPRRQGRQKQDDINGVEIENLRLQFQGHVHSPRLTYRIVIKGDTDVANDWRTYYAYASYKFADELRFTAGQMKLPFGRQELTSESALQLVNRSVANEMFNLDRAINARVHGTFAKRLSYVVAVANGVANQNDQVSHEELDTNFAYVGRLVAQLLGERIRTESDVAHSKAPRLEAGLSFAYNDDNGDRRPGAAYSIPDRIRSGRGIGGNAMADLTGTDYFLFGADAAFRYRGFSATAEYWVRTIDGDSEFSHWERLTGRDDATHQQGGYVQAGYFIIPKKVEVAARLGGVWDNDGDDVWETAFGVNYFPWGTYKVLLQADFTHIAEAPLTVSSPNWSQNDEINMVRVQMQLKF